ncbi:MAG: type IV secretion system DNA-binding domain-containing protein [Candidatus Daviesbacteria bacterium]|nr:type IV secretion system DNA-binding domain-containing protein [Candidatus Daviesbacteria bacterium]
MEVTDSATSIPELFNAFILFIVLGLILAALILAGIYFSRYFIAWYRDRNREKDSLDSVLIKVAVTRDNEIKIDATEQLISTLYSIRKSSGFMNLTPQQHFSFELVALHESITFYISVPKTLQDLIEKQVHGAYPDAEIKVMPEYNIFSENGQTAYAMYTLKNADYFPIKTYKDLPTDPLSALTAALAKMQAGEGAVIQLVMSPAGNEWKDAGKKFVKKEKEPGKPDAPKPPPDARQLEAVESKITKPGFNVAIRIVTSSTSKDSAKAHLSNIKAAFEQFSGPYNNFSGAKVKSEKGFMTDFVYRYMPMYSKTPVLTADEIASIYHFPNKQITTPHINWLSARSAPASEKIPMEGLYLGKSIFRGTERPIYIADQDRERHMYMIGRTGTGKTTLMKTLMLQDIMAGRGLAFIDPHGDAAEEMLSLIPPHRAKDVIYFNPGDVDRPFGMNMMEAITEDEKHFITTEIIGLMYKLYDPNKTGIIGPRFEHGIRNAMLTVMSVPGNTFVEVMRIMQDPEYVRELLPHVTDPVVRRYWTDQIAHTADFHKSEVLDYTVSKFGRFVTNRMLRNIIGQSKSSFNFRQIMDEGKILIVNLSKGTMGEENSNFLGLILVPKILAAAMSRANIPEAERRPFYLYVDEFQNFATETFATILSEARKYKLDLIVANQFIGQMPEDIKNAIFGNVGTVISYRVGVTDANFLQHEFAPVFTEQDLVNIEAWHVYMKTQVHGEPVPPFSMKVSIDFNAWNGMKRPEIAAAIKELSRLTYGRDVATVEADINRRTSL